MAFCIKNIWRVTKGKDFVKALIHQRFFATRPQLTSPANRPALAKRTKTSFIQWNSNLSLSNGTPLYSTNAQFHYLAEHTLICNAVYITNVGGRNFAKATDEVPTIESHMKDIREVYDNARFEKEKQRLKRKGVMKDITVKIPEGVLTVRQRF